MALLEAHERVSHDEEIVGVLARDGDRGVVVDAVVGASQTADPGHRRQLAGILLALEESDRPAELHPHEEENRDCDEQVPAPVGDPRHTASHQ